jgi:AraC-like DNA-binding protein
MGMADVAHPFRIVRTQQRGAAFLACSEGEGRILVEGQWRECRAGMACLLPPGVLAAFEATPRVRWRFAWVRYRPSLEKTPYAGFESPVLAAFDSEVFKLAMSGLYRACAETPVPCATHHWLELIQTYVRHFVQNWQPDDRLANLWSQVERNLGAVWTGEQLARQANMCFEHLRRLCRRQLGRSPMHQVVFLRMRRAAHLLVSSPDKLDAIAASVGYSNSFAFSVAFKKWFGCAPSEFRRRSTKSWNVFGKTLSAPGCGAPTPP